MWRQITVSRSGMKKGLHIWVGGKGEAKNKEGKNEKREGRKERRGKEGEKGGREEKNEAMMAGCTDNLKGDGIENGKMTALDWIV